ncbi:MAG: Ig-like domain-containing protein [Verrucomicrobia bacterium]|nr:Ig-like domain-containing protein [Verrucomicrobiota bacterium]
MKPLLNRLTVLAATLASAQLASGAILVLNPTDDSTIRTNTLNQGTSISLNVGDTLDTTTDNEFLRSALAFDLSTLTGATINSVTLTFTVRVAETGSQNATMTLNLHQLTSSFTNGGVTWTSRDGTNDWTNPGGDFGGVLASTTGNPNTAAIGSTVSFSGATLAGAVQDMIGGSLYLLVKSNVENIAFRNLFQFYSSNQSGGNLAYIPKLTIDYSLPDAIAPAIVPPTNPADDATGVLVTTNLVATFDEAIALEDGGTITIDDLGAGPDTVITLPDARVNVVGGTDLVITPASPLATSTSYAIWISNNAVKDLASPANFFAGISDTTTWSFQTAADGTSPALVSTTPADGSTGATPTSNLVAEFDEAIAAGSGNIRIRNLSTSGNTVIPVGDPRVSISGNTLTIDPTTDLGWADDYAIQIDAGAIKDVTGNAFAGILDDATWNFTVAGAKVLAAFDDRCDSVAVPPLNIFDKTRTTNLLVGPISSGRYSRSYLTFDLAGASAATGETTLVLSPEGTEGNTSSVPQTFTLFVLGADWNGATFPGPEGTAVATVNFSPATGPDDNRGISFTSAALTTAFNNAVGGNLHLGIKSDAEGSGFRSFLFLASLEDVGLEPRLNYTVASGGSTFASWITGKSGVGGQTAVSDDPDGDGNDNGVENFFGTEPGVFSAGVVVGTVNPGTGTFTFTHPQGALASDLTVGYRWSTDLVTFHNDGASTGGTTVTFSTVPDPVEAGTPTTVTATVTGTPVQKLFLRVEVTQ